MKSKHWVLELAVCAPMPIAIPGLPPINGYRFWAIGICATKRDATAKMKEFSKLNPGYMFHICQEWIGK